MNTLPSPFLRTVLVLLALVCSSVRIAAADSPELAEARARLLEAFQGGQTDNDNQVKQLRAKISALEYVAAARAASGGDSTPKSITIDFPGGPASALVAALAKSDRESGFNVIGEKADLAIELPAFSVRNADPNALAYALNGILQPRGYVLAPSVRTAIAQANVFTLRKQSPYEMDHRAQGDLQSFQLAPYLTNQSVDDIVSAIRTAWELDPARAPTALRLKFHPPTGILLVSAPRDGIAIVMTVLKELRRSDSPNPKSPDRK
jgi:hypothetical protein